MAKKRISLTLSEEVVERIDSLTDQRGDNRSRTVESILEQFFGSNALSTAAVFCGDREGKSLRRHDGRMIIESVLQHLKDQGVEKVYLLAGVNEEEFRNVLGNSFSGMELEYLSEDPKGTAKALSQLEDEISESFVAVNGHVLTDVDLGDMWETHKNSGAEVTVALTAVQDPTEYGVARLKGDRILGFEEKPEEGKAPSRLINAGTYILEPSIFDILEHESIESVFEELAEKGELSGYIYGGKWNDFN